MIEREAKISVIDSGTPPDWKKYWWNYHSSNPFYREDPKRDAVFLEVLVVKPHYFWSDGEFVGWAELHYGAYFGLLDYSTSYCRQP